ncbi:hypothetical protein B0H13DRAFT_1633968 [Mycena leptocephala]|nr:hypothetical protein B0H13DRAFT_1633968 [Mycena leptocephala]
MNAECFTTAVGVIVYKAVCNFRYIEKRINLRVEHVRHSKCRQEFLDHVKRNHEVLVEAKKKGGQYLFPCPTSSCPYSLSIPLRPLPIPFPSLPRPPSCSALPTPSSPLAYTPTHPPTHHPQHSST